MKLAGFCFVIVGVLLSLILFRTYGFNSNSDTYSLDGMRNSIEEMKNSVEFVKNCSLAMAVLIIIAGISLLADNNVETSISASRNHTQLLINHSVLQTLIPALIGTPINIDNLEIAEKDLPGKYSWTHAKIICPTLGEGWRLPTKDELNEIYNNKDKIANLTNDHYWCSTEHDNYSAWKQELKNGKQSLTSIYDWFNVRPVRTV